MQLQKEVQSNPVVKKSVQPQKTIVKKDVKSKVAASDGRPMAKFLITTIQVNLVSNPSETWRKKFCH